MNADTGNPISDSEMEGLRTQVEALNSNGLSWSAIEKESGIPKGTLSPWVAGKYGGDNSKVARRVRGWLDSREERAELTQRVPEPPVFQATPTASAILNRLQYAHHLRDFALISGGPGIGKTAAVTQYKATHNLVFAVTCSPSCAGVQTILGDVLAEVGGGDKGTPQAMSRKICAKLKDTSALLIVDEAQHLTASAIEELRAIHDRSGVALALIGNEDLYSRFSSITEASMHAQVRSRIGMWYRQLRPSDKDVEVLADAWGIADLKARGFLRDIAQKPGALRSVTKVLRLASILREGDGALSLSDIRTAWQQLSTEIGRAA